ncbi:MAG TPA: hypothetical protein VJ372_08875 [Pyrinomonadaceae bacterium]|nr:hypothetical protein [Pyrinomonadaceae bacterium]
MNGPKVVIAEISEPGAKRLHAREGLQSAISGRLLNSPALQCWETGKGSAVREGDD